MAAKIGPKIALNFDTNHKDPAELAIHTKLVTIDPRKKIVYFQENRVVEYESLNQYSLELFSKDAPLSTASSCILLNKCMDLPNQSLSIFPTILELIYADSDFKKLFIEKRYFEFNPYDHGLNKCFQYNKLDRNTMTPSQKNMIAIVEGLFTGLDRVLPGLKTDEGRMKNIILNINDARELVCKNADRSDFIFFQQICEALAFIKIKQVLAKLPPDSDKSQELSLDMINRLYQDQEGLKKLWWDLALIYRTQFQAKKVIHVVEKVLSAKNADPNTIFLVRDGLGHREHLISHLTQHYKRGEIKEIVLTLGDLPKVEEKIREKFAVAPNLLPQPIDPVLGTRSGNVETTHPLLQGLPVRHFSE